MPPAPKSKPTPKTEKAAPGAQLLKDAVNPDPDVAVKAIRALPTGRAGLDGAQLSAATDVLLEACAHPLESRRKAALGALKALGARVPAEKRRKAVEALLRLGESKQKMAELDQTRAAIAAIARHMTREEERQIVDRILSPLDAQKVHDAAIAFSDEGARYLGLELLKSEVASQGTVREKYRSLLHTHNKHFTLDVLQGYLERTLTEIDELDPSKKYQIFKDHRDLHLYGLYLDLQHLHLWLDAAGRARIVDRLDAARAATSGEEAARFKRMIVEAEDQVKAEAKGWLGLIGEGRRFGPQGTGP